MAAPPPTDTGKHCALAACRLADFLPLECPHCHHPFCSAHVAPPAHACPSDPHLDQLDPPSSRTGPELRDLLPDPNRHQRPAFQVPSPEATALRAKQLAALDAFKAASRPKTQPPASAAQPATRKSSGPVVELMRLKARAAPLDPRHARRPGDVPLPERVFLHAQLGHDGATVRPLWAAKVRSQTFTPQQLETDLLSRTHTDARPSRRAKRSTSSPSSSRSRTATT